MGTEASETGFRFVHTMLRVKDIDASVDFYTNILGMKVIRRRDDEIGEYTNVFLAYGPESEVAALELTYNWGQTEGYDHGTGFGHIALQVPDVYEAAKSLEAAGAEFTRLAGPIKSTGRIIAFVKDPDGYKIELVEPRD